MREGGGGFGAEGGGAGEEGADGGEVVGGEGWGVFGEEDYDGWDLYDFVRGVSKCKCEWGDEGME